MHVEDNINGTRPLEAKTPGSHDADLLSSLRGQPIGLSAPGHHWMNGSSMQPVFDAGIELEAHHDPSSASALEVSLLDLCDPSPLGVCGVNAKVSKNIVVLRIPWLQVDVQGFCGLLAAGEEPGFLRVDLESSLLKALLQGAESQDGFTGNIVRIPAFDVIGDIVHPSLQLNGGVSLDQISERSEEDQFGYCRSLRTTLKDAFLIVGGIACNAFCLDEPRASVKVKRKLQVQRWIMEFFGWFNEVVKLHCVVKAGEVCQTGHSVDALVLANLSLQHSPDRDGKAVFVRACKVPWHILVQRQLPAMELMLPVRVPQPVKARCKGNGPLDALILWDHDNVGVSKLDGKFSRALHLGE